MACYPLAGSSDPRRVRSTSHTPALGTFRGPRGGQVSLTLAWRAGLFSLVSLEKMWVKKAQLRSLETTSGLFKPRLTSPRDAPRSAAGAAFPDLPCASAAAPLERPLLTG